MRRPLRPYQIEMLRYALRVKHPALFVEMRLGKTIVAIRWVKSLRLPDKVLVVSPFSAFDSWVTELDREGEEKPTLLIGTWQQRLTNLYQGIYPDRRHWYLINKEGHLAIPQIAEKHWDIVILDESTFIKSPKSQVSNFFVKNFKEVPYRAILTGTPNPESDLDFFQQLQFLNPEILSAENYWKYRFKNCEQFGHKWTMVSKAKHNLMDKLARNCFFLSRKDVNLGSDKIYEKRFIILPDALKEVYDTIIAEFILELDGVIDKTIYATQKFIWLRRLYGGFVRDKFVSKVKLDELKELLVGELSKNSVVVWVSFIQELKMLERELRRSKIRCKKIYGGVPQSKRSHIIKEFNKKRFRVLLAQPECFKFGVDLSVADTAIYYSTPLGCETRLQTEDRIVNVGKSNAPLIIDLIMKDTTDEDVVLSVLKKERRVDMTKRIIRRLTNAASSQKIKSKRRKSLFSRQKKTYSGKKRQRYEA